MGVAYLIVVDGGAAQPDQSCVLLSPKDWIIHPHKTGNLGRVPALQHILYCQFIKLFNIISFILRSFMDIVYTKSCM